MKKVLWIEDEIYKIGELGDVLKEEGIEVITATNKQEWENALKKSIHYEFIITDIMLPNEKLGLELLKRIRHERPNIPILVLTGLPAQRYQNEILNLGADLYLKKPVLLSEFRDTVKKLLRLGDNEK